LELDEFYLLGDAASNDIEVTWAGSPGAYTITVITDTQADWHQLCEPGDQQARQLCRETATSQPSP